MKRWEVVYGDMPRPRRTAMLDQELEKETHVKQTDSERHETRMMPPPAVNQLRSAGASTPIPR